MVIVSNPKRRALVAALLLGVIGVWQASALGPKHKPKVISPKQAVENMEEQWRKAQLAGDANAMSDLLSDDFVGITAFGKVNTKAQYLARIRDRVVQVQSMDLSDVKVKIIGAHVAVVTSRAEVTGINEGTQVKGAFRYTRVYERNAGVWRITSFEATRANGNAGASPTDAPPAPATASNPNASNR